MDDYQITFAEEQNLRNPKNRFLGCFCHANEVDDTWGCGLSFSCGIIFFSILVGLGVIYDYPIISGIQYKVLRWYWFNWLTFFIILRVISDVFAVVGIVYALVSICGTNYKRAVIAYYCFIVTLVINTVYSIAFIFLTFKYYLYVGLIIFGWVIDEFFLILFCWFLFCNMVVIGRKNRQNASTTNFI